MSYRFSPALLKELDEDHGQLDVQLKAEEGKRMWSGLGRPWGGREGPYGVGEPRVLAYCRG